MHTPSKAANLLATAAILLASLTLTACNKAQAPGDQVLRSVFRS